MCFHCILQVALKGPILKSVIASLCLMLSGRSYLSCFFHRAICMHGSMYPFPLFKLMILVDFNGCYIYHDTEHV